MIELKAYKVNKLEVENRAKPGTQLKLQNQLKYNVNYMDDDKKCLGIMELRITDAQMNPFEIKIEMVAEFTYGDEDEKADIHTTSFDQLFPFVRQIVNTAASFTGMSGLMIPIMRLNKDTVQVNPVKTDESSPLN
ncbi:MAG: hypothetical protein LIO62_06335 [Clostridiales bacterium]|nr:hypothetical protein [Clostridiales bacterium]